jgi:glycosyl transferase family WbsX
MGYRTQRLIVIFFIGLVVNSCNSHTSSITATQATSAAPATPTSSPAPSTTPSPTNIPGPNEYIVIAQLNLWYFGAGCNGGFEDFVHCSGRRTTPFEPALGHTYISSDPRVLRQQIDWAADYGVDAFSLEWTTPRGIGTSGSLEDNIDDAFLRAGNLSRIRWCIFYDTILRITQDPAVNADLSNGVDFDDPKVYNAFVSDFDHFSTKYFAQPQYLKIDGRPVIYIYAAWNFHGNFAGAVEDARAKALAQGYDVYIVGDVLAADRFNRDLVSQFDANTTFTFLIQGLPIGPDMGTAAPAIDTFFQSWRNKIQELKVAGRDDLVNFQPGWAPQFDNRLFEEANSIYVPALSKEQVTVMAQVARDNAIPAGSLDQKFIWINTWNNWAEATTIEPTANLGPKYPAGNYQFDMLEIVRDVFGQQSFGNGPPFPATEIPLTAQAPATLESAPTPPGETPLGGQFTGTWKGPDPADGSITTLVLVQTANSLTGTFSDTYTGNIQPPGYEGSGSGTVLTNNTAQMIFNLTRWDGKAAQAAFSLTLSNQNATLTLGCSAGCPIVLQRQ